MADVSTPKLKRHLRTAPPPPSNDGNAFLLSNMVYSLLRECAPHTGIQSVRVPAGRDHAIAILFEDGRDVIVRFEEVL